MTRARTHLYKHTHTHLQTHIYTLAHLQVSDRGDPLLQEHLSQDLVSIGHTLHQLLPPLSCLRSKLLWDVLEPELLSGVGWVGLLPSTKW